MLQCARGDKEREMHSNIIFLWVDGRKKLPVEHGRCRLRGEDFFSTDDMKLMTALGSEFDTASARRTFVHRWSRHHGRSLRDLLQQA